VTAEWNGEDVVSLEVDGDDPLLSDHANHSDQSTAASASQRQLHKQVHKLHYIFTNTNLDK